ncbi:LuxR C-terminal-related transcriptional regulator [Leifsonia aquatica]|uniref:helix-turn-helix transcriptional regulator n=1 Tax=Leifsonia aquatica TaxID=144185 RepID=UPI00384DBBDF
MNLYDADAAAASLERARSTGSDEDVAKAIVANAWPLYSAHHAVLVSTLAELPGTVLDTDPLLRLLHPMAPVLLRTLVPFRPLTEDGPARAQAMEAFDVLLVAQLIALRAAGDVSSAMVHAKRLEERITRGRAESRERMDGPQWFYHLQIGSTLLSAGDSARSLLVLATARQLAELAAQPDASRVVLGRIALAHAVRGSIDDADRALTQATGMPPVTAAHANASRSTEAAAAALIGVERLAPELDDLIAALEPYDSVEFSWPFALLARTRALLAQHRVDEAVEAVRLAGGAHARQPGSFAADVLASASIDAFAAQGDHDRAATFTKTAAAGSALTALATIRSRLHEGELEAAERLLHGIGSNRGLAPGLRTEYSVLSAWLEFARSGTIVPETATELHRIGTRPANRRMLTSVPRPVVDAVRLHVPARTGASFDRLVADLEHVEFRPRPRLTPAELRVLRALRADGTTAEVAAALQVSPNTVKSQLKSVYRKLGCSNREEAIRIATGLRLLPPRDG